MDDLLKTAPTRNDILEKRVAAVIGTWDRLQKKFPETFTGCHLDPELVREVVESYLDDREAYMNRHRIKYPNRIMYHKVAGMMAAAICKYRPIQFTGPSAAPRSSLFQNEMLAVWHGLAVCTEPYNGNQEALRSAVASDAFPGWETEFLRLLHRHPDSAQAFMLIFYTFSMDYFRVTVDDCAPKSVTETDG